MNQLLCSLLTSAQSPNTLLCRALPPSADAKPGRLFRSASRLHKKARLRLLPSRSKRRFSPPGKNMTCPCTTAAFTLPHILRTGFGMLCSPCGAALSCSAGKPSQDHPWSWRSPLQRSSPQGFGLICDLLATSLLLALRASLRLFESLQAILICSSARRFALRLLPDLGSPLSPCLRLVLFEVVKLTSSRKMHRGLAPHKIMPMPGTQIIGVR